jgi:hypothetical protein
MHLKRQSISTRLSDSSLETVNFIIFLFILIHNGNLRLEIVNGGLHNSTLGAVPNLKYEIKYHYSLDLLTGYILIHMCEYII